MSAVLEVTNIKKNFGGISAVDFYGLSEIIGPGVATECVEGRDGLHINEDHFLPEVVEPVTGEPLAAGMEGELVLTCLTKQALPILRYRTGDVTRLDLEACRCGRTTARMARIKGRTDDMLVVRGVNVFPSSIEHILRSFPEVVEYRATVYKISEMDRLRIEVEDRLQQPERISQEIKLRLGLRVEVDSVPLGTLPRFEGKGKRFVDQRKDRNAK